MALLASCGVLEETKSDHGGKDSVLIVDGELKLLEAIGRRIKVRDLEAFTLTGHGSMGSAVECMKLGAFAHLPKPYELQKLLDVLKNA